MSVNNIEIHFKIDNNQNFRLPVVPSTFSLEDSSIINCENIAGLGEVSIYGGKGLKTIELSSFFPSKNYPFNAYTNVPKPYDCVATVKKLFENGTVFRLIITNTDINIPCIISNFTYGKQDGTDDVYYTVSLQEYRKIEVVTVSQQNSTQNNTRPAQPTTTTQKKTHKVVKGDCLWDIAQKYYGKGNLYPKIKEANWNTYPSLKKNNIIYTNMTLVIP